MRIFPPVLVDEQNALSSKTQRAAVCSSRLLRGLNYIQAYRRGQHFGMDFSSDVFQPGSPRPETQLVHGLKGGRPELNRRPPEPQSGALTN